MMAAFCIFGELRDFLPNLSVIRSYNFGTFDNGKIEILALREEKVT
jgi:hypothetical protein